MRSQSIAAIVVCGLCAGAAAFGSVVPRQAVTTVDQTRQTDDPAMAPVNAFVKALENADIDVLAPAFSEDATVFMPFDAVPRRFTGKAEIVGVFRRFFDQMLASGRQAPFSQIAPVDLHVQRVSDSTAVITFHLGASAAEAATRPSRAGRRTFVVVREGDRWLIAHMHASNTQSPEDDK